MYIEQENKSKGLTARILGEQPTILQKIFIWFMLLTLLLWPIGFYVSIFFWDTSGQSSIDEICLWGATLTIRLYPIYLFPLIRLWFKLSKKVGKSWLFYLCPLIPMAVFFLFVVTLALSAYVERKPKGCDFSTYKRLNEAYAIDINHVYCDYEILEGADPSTFKVLNEHYATDMHHVWFNDNIIEGAEPTTFVIPNGGISNLAHDAHDYYMGNQPLHVADMGSFRQIDENWALDSLYVYYLDVDVLADKKAVSVGDSRTFKALNGFYAVDAKCVYYKNNIVKGADPASFAVLKGQYRYGQDRHRVYYEAYGSKIRNFNALRHKNMKDGIYNAFHTDGKTVYNPELMAMPVGTDFLTIHKVELCRNWYADSKHVYYENRLLPGANPKTFVIFPSHYVNADCVSDNNKNADYSHDDSHVYYRDSLMSDVDIASFVCGYDFVVEKSFAFDKSRYYEGTPNPRIEKLRQGKYQVVK